MPNKHAKCSQCGSENTEIEVDEETHEDGDESIHVTVWCLDCRTYSPFPLDEDWREYA